MWVFVVRRTPALGERIQWCLESCRPDAATEDRHSFARPCISFRAGLLSSASVAWCVPSHCSRTRKLCPGHQHRRRHHPHQWRHHLGSAFWCGPTTSHSAMLKSTSESKPMFRHHTSHSDSPVTSDLASAATRVQLPPSEKKKPQRLVNWRSGRTEGCPRLKRETVNQMLQKPETLLLPGKREPGWQQRPDHEFLPRMRRQRGIRAKTVVG